MVLLKGLNYDHTGQQSTKLITKVGIGSTTYKILNTEGFADSDYFVIDPGTEKSEIIKISTIDDNRTFTAAAAKFEHGVNAELFRLPYNQMKFYYSTDATGTYTYITDSITEMSYVGIFTNYSYADGTTSLYYKRTFYNSTTDVESDIAEADYWQTGDETLYITPEELRKILQLGEDDPPSPEDMYTLIKVAQKQIALEVNSSSQDILFLSTMLLAKHYVMRALATKALSKGYITINVEGRNVTKAYQELVLEAENTFKEYQLFVRNLTRSEVGKTNFMDDTTLVDPEIRAAYIDNWTGTTNAMRERYPDSNLYGTRRRLR